MAVKKDGIEPSLRFELVVLLLILYLFYVIGDLVTTQWLILNDPYGILHEANPIGRILYMNNGILGLAIAKIAVFIPLIFVTIVFDAKYRDVWWFREMTETTLLGFLTYSLIVVLNNIFAILVVNGYYGVSSIEGLFPIIKMVVFVLSVSLTAAIVYLRGYTDRSKIYEIIIGSIIVAGPLLLYKPLMNFLTTNYWLSAWYVLSVLTFLGTFFYIREELKK